MIRTFIQVMAFILTLEAAFFLAKGSLGLSGKVIAELSSAKWDFNSNLVENLAHQRVNTWVGVILLLVAFGLQMANALWPMRWSDFEVHTGAALYAVVLGAVVGVGAHSAGEHIARNVAIDINAVLEAEANSNSRDAP